MLELSRSDGSDIPLGGFPTTLAFGGDTLNTSIYMARLGLQPRYITALGVDPLSDWLAKNWEAEGVDCSSVRRLSGELPGLYFIDTDNDGERSFFYWRDRAPVKRLLDDPVVADTLLANLMSSSYVYLSGITLAVFTERSRRALLDWLPSYRSAGGKVVFDNNYRPRLWPSISDARDAYNEIYTLTDVALPTLDDECLLFGDMSSDDLVDRLKGVGVTEIALKQGELGCRVIGPEQDAHVLAVPTSVVDTTSAGDSFNAGYLASRIRGRSQTDAAALGCKLASLVIQHRGAIIPVEKTDLVAKELR